MKFSAEIYVLGFCKFNSQINVVVLFSISVFSHLSWNQYRIEWSLHKLGNMQKNANPIALLNRQ